MRLTDFSFTLRGGASSLAGCVCVGLLLVCALGCNPPADNQPGEAPAAHTTPTGDVVSRVGEPLAANATLRQVLEHPGSLQRIERVAQILQRSGPEDLESLMYEFENATHDRGDFEYGLFGHWWARFDPQAAFFYADTHLRTDAPNVILHVVRSWAQQDPVGALESKMLNNTGTHMPALREGLTDTFVVGWFEAGDAAGGEEALVDWILSQQDGAGIQRAFKAYARMRVLRDGDQETLEWIKERPYEPEVNRLLLAGALSVIAHQNPKLASEWMILAQNDGVDVRTFMPRIARSWAHHDPRAALDWVMTTPESNERMNAVLGVARHWVRRDESGMADWLATVKGSPWTDSLRVQAIRAHVLNHRYHVDWPALIQRANAISELRDQNRMVGYLLQSWSVVDMEAAKAWLDENPGVLSEADLERALKVSPQKRANILATMNGG